MPEKRAGKDSTCKIKREHVHQNKGIMFPVLLPESITSSVTAFPGGSLQSLVRTASFYLKASRLP